jgi:tetratricopeptide (TPR) repeat protein
MSLLLDARKKIHGKPHRVGTLDFALEPLVTVEKSQSAQDGARQSGRNLFQAKHATKQPQGSIHPIFLYGLLTSLILFILGSAYVWHEISMPISQNVSTQNNFLNQRINSPALELTVPAVEPSINPISSDAHEPSTTPFALQAKPHQPFNKSYMSKRAIAPHAIAMPPHTESLDDFLNQAYQEYRAGSFDKAQQHYQTVLTAESNNPDALLGLAAIAQHHHADSLAQNYYARVLKHDPRNAIAHAGIASFSTDDNRESRLKTLLNEQPEAPSLQLALGNHYAEQSKWNEAQQAYFNAFKLAPNNAELAFNLAISLEKIGQRKLAAKYYQQALILDKNHSEGFNHQEIELRAAQLNQ